MRIARLQSLPAIVLRALPIALVVASLLAFATAACADVGETIILRCTHNQSLSGFSQSDYQKALKELSADTEEYSPCSSLIRKAELAAAAGGGSGSGGGGGGATPVAVAASPAQQRALRRAQHSAPGPVSLGGQVVKPGVVHVDIASAFSSLPTPLLATLAFLLACLLVVAGGALRARLRARRSA